MRVLVTGSRTWTDRDPVRAALNDMAATALDLGQRLTVVHGGARGVDTIAGNWCAEKINLGWPVSAECHDADWHVFGKRAGIIRNKHMVDLGADLCLAFIRDDSPGAAHCAGLAEKAGIQTRVYRWRGRA